MQTAQIIAISAAVLAALPARAESQSDIVWPTYDQAQRASDTQLNCPALDTEIAHVAADVSLLNHARARVEDVLHSAFDLERYGGSNGPGGQRVPGGAVHGKEAYARARGQIVESLTIARKRQDWLASLKPACRPAP
ncbi:MAG TPA: hypothetical protein VG798_00790 [Rhizomicrobium sp.]|nr:hypothetical protein [Rhizomicrobium sp.]